jgi:hypothetical protein
MGKQTHGDPLTGGGLDLRDLVFRALDHARENGHEEFLHLPAAEVANDLREYDWDLENDDPAELTPLVTEWRRRHGIIITEDELVTDVAVIDFPITLRVTLTAGQLRRYQHYHGLTSGSPRTHVESYIRSALYSSHESFDEDDITITMEES